jgi:hypothetical protein
VGPNQFISEGAVIGTLSPDWHHFAVSANGVTLSTYWDGALISTVDYLGTINNNAQVPWLAIGADITSLDPLVAPTPPLFTGQMDDMALWGRSLSEVEIQAIYNSGLFGLSLSEVQPVLTVSPKVFIGKAGPNSVIIFWGTEFTGFRLESSPTPEIPGSWMEVQGVVNNSVTLNNIMGAQFFRLVKP